MTKTFNESIYSALKRVPKGRVTTYKILAEAIGTKAYRAVGQAMRRNPYAPKVPCHRCVSSDGSIGGFAGSKSPGSKEIKRKINLLRQEGIRVKGNKILNFRKLVIRAL